MDSEHWTIWFIAFTVASCNSVSWIVGASHAFGPCSTLVQQRHTVPEKCHHLRELCLLVQRQFSEWLTSPWFHQLPLQAIFVFVQAALCFQDQALITYLHPLTVAAYF